MSGIDVSGNVLAGYENLGAYFNQPARNLSGIEATLWLKGTTGTEFESEDAISLNIAGRSKTLYVKSEEQIASAKGWITKVVANEKMVDLLQVAVRKNCVFMSITYEEYMRFIDRINQYGGYTSLPYIPFIYLSRDEFHDDGLTVYQVISTICTMLGYGLQFGIYSHYLEQITIPAGEPLFSVLFRLIAAYNPLIFFENNTLIIADKRSFYGLSNTAEITGAKLTSRQRLYRQVTDRVHIYGKSKGRYDYLRDRYAPNVGYRSDSIPMTMPVIPSYELDKKTFLRKLKLIQQNVTIAWEGKPGDTEDYNLIVSGTETDPDPHEVIDQYRYTQQMRQALDIYGNPWFDYLYLMRTEKGEQPVVDPEENPDPETDVPPVYREISKIKEVRVMSYTSRENLHPLVYRWYRNRSGYIWYLKSDGTTGKLYMDMDDIPVEIYGPMLPEEYLKGPVEIEWSYLYLDSDMSLSRLVRQRFAWSIVPNSEENNPYGILFELEISRQHSEINLSAGDIAFRQVANESIGFRKLTKKSHIMHTQRWYFDRWGRYRSDDFSNTIQTEIPKYKSQKRSMQLESSINELGSMFINIPADIVEDQNLVRQDDLDYIAYNRYSNQPKGDLIYSHQIDQPLYLERGWPINPKSYQSCDGTESISKPSIVSGAWIESVEIKINEQNKGSTEILVEAQLN